VDNKHWRKLTELKGQLPEKHFARISKYQARSTYARELRSTRIQGLSPASAEGYFVMLKLSLAYSAVELIHPIVVNNMVVTDAKVATALRAGKFTKLIDALSKSTFDRGSKPEVTHAWANLADDQTNLLPLIKQCRHIMFHGAFSPSDTGLTALSRQTLLLGLALKSLESADVALEARITKLYAKRRNSGL
jgi:hypothetical protein